jgi:hypothetical protein
MAISLTAYTIVSTTLAGALAIAAFVRAPARPHFQEIDVERINIVEKDGRTRLTISNAERSPGWLIHGRVVPGRPKTAGMIFFNDEGEENGGLIFGGKKIDGKPTSFGHLSFDQYDGDQNMALEYIEEHGHREEGLSFNEQPDMPLLTLIDKNDSVSRMPAGPAKDAAAQALHALGAKRVFVGRTEDYTAIVQLSDRANHPRLRFKVDSAGAASIEFLDATGKVVRRINGTE